MTNFNTLSDRSYGSVQPSLRHIGISDLWASLRAGAQDFWSKPSHYVFLILIYPVVGILLALWAAGSNAWPLLYPLISGFALIGPFVALPLYEVSRRRELGEDIDWGEALHVARSPSMPSILAVGVLLLALFTVWIIAAQAIYATTFGNMPPATGFAFINQVLTTPEGWQLLVVGNLVGLAFAFVALMLSVVAFPLMLDRGANAWEAVVASARAVATNPLPMLAWGVIVGVLLMVGSLPFFVGLAIVLPILGHATWHLYRRLVA